MQAPQQLVKNASTSSTANRSQSKSAPRPASAPTAGVRFLGFLISALGAMSV